MDRLTHQKWSDDIDLSQEYGYKHIYQRLYELENKIEEGRMICQPAADVVEVSELKALQAENAQPYFSIRQNCIHRKRTSFKRNGG